MLGRAYRSICYPITLRTSHQLQTDAVSTIPRTVHSIPIPCPRSRLYIAPVLNHTPHRGKHASSKKDDDEDDDWDEDDRSLSRDSKVVKFKASSMRMDLVLKSALGIARNKIEKVFYESRIRLNGRKVTKKSAQVHVGDEIDMVKGLSPKNPGHLYVSRVEILDMKPTADEEEAAILISARRYKTLLIENYNPDPYKQSTANS